LENPTLSVVHVVDDDEAVRDSMRALLESYGIEVCAYSSANEFLLVSPAQRRGCVLLDLHMPGMSGLELLELLQTHRSKIPVIAISGRGDSVLKERAVRAGARTLLYKPVTSDALMSAVTQALLTAELCAF
jgi:two-component system, LuxR family, response regulator FixJ